MYKVRVFYCAWFVEQDGYVEAELMDGRRGLVPIVFIQKLSGDELLDFNQRVLLGMKECADSASTTIPQDLEHLHHSGIIDFYTCPLIYSIPPPITTRGIEVPTQIIHATHLI